MLKPLADRVLVEVDVEESKTAGGILIPDTAQKKSQKGTVLAVGPGKVLDNGERLPIDVAVGDRVLFAKYSGVDIEENGKKMLLLSERDVLGKL
ncbi:chaperonin GroS [Veillonellaceae bacterium DNF00626]|jgi:hypothetical protein|nr:chaperonin GroS [Veillonellaceae bacterium DNF00626]